MKDKFLVAIYCLLSAAAGAALALVLTPHTTLDDHEEMAKALRECETELDAR